MAEEYSIMPYVKLTIITFLFVIIIGWQYFIYNHRRIVAHWGKLKCSPMYAPLSGLVKGKTGFDAVEDGADNILKCIWVKVKEFFNELMEPFHYLLQVLYGVILGTLNRANSQRGQLSVIRNYIKKIIEMVMKRLNNLSGAFIFVFLKVRDALKRGLASFQVMAYMLNTSSKTMEAMMNGVIGDMAYFAESVGWLLSWFLMGPFAMLAFPSLWQCVLCFSGDTLISTKDGEIPISELKLGQILLGGGKIIAIQVCRPPENMPMYSIGNATVSSSHLVYCDNSQKWIPIDHHPDAVLSSEKYETLYCLTTTNHQINVGPYIFSDWEEFESKENTIFQKTLIYQDLCCQNYLDWKECLEETYPPGFSRIPVELYNHSSLISKIRGKSLTQIQWFQPITVDGTRPSYFVSGTTMVSSNGKWIPVSISPDFVLSGYHSDYYENIIMKNGILTIDRYQFRDYLETNNTNTHCEIRLKCLENLNSK